MKVSRRDVVRAGLAAGAAAAVAGCAIPMSRVGRKGLPDRIEPPKGPEDPEYRLANRLGYGPVPGEPERIRRMGHAAYVEEQLAADQPESPYLLTMLHRMDALQLDAATLQDLPETFVLGQLQQAAMLRAVYSPNQLFERMVDLWSNHFSIYAKKAEGAYRKPTDDLKVVRAHALGRFSDLLKASAKSPSMLIYLDAEQNHKGVPNENYARELMELHTLGVDGGYTYKDITEVARCLTGWTVEDRFLRPYWTWRFDPEQHDDGAKTVLGHRIPPGAGERDVEIVLDILARHPSTSRFIAKKICRHFLADPSEDWIERTAALYRETITDDGAGDIKAMLRPILLSDELLQGEPILKRPFDFVASALRAVYADTDAARPIQDHLDKMGQPLYMWPMPDGYPDKADAWTGSLLGRWNFSWALAHDLISGTSPRIEEVGAKAGGPAGLAATILGGDAPATCVDGSLQATVARCLASPQFQWR